MRVAEQIQALAKLFSLDVLLDAELPGLPQMSGGSEGKEFRNVARYISTGRLEWSEASLSCCSIVCVRIKKTKLSFAFFMPISLLLPGLGGCLAILFLVVFLSVKICFFKSPFLFLVLRSKSDKCRSISEVALSACVVEELKEQLQSEAPLGTAYLPSVAQLVGNTAQRLTIGASRQDLAKHTETQWGGVL